MLLKDLSDKSVAIIGYGREGQAVERALKDYAPGAQITIRDQKDGDDYLQGLDQFDVIIKSPGVPPQPELEAVKDKLTNSTQIFLEECAAKGAQVIGVTGSKGKSTTVSLIYQILKAAGKDAHLVGNIGTPTLDYLDKIGPETIFAQEMSSFQLMDCTMSPPLAVVTAFFPDHLDVHKTLENYLACKQHIARFQSDTDFVFYDATNEGSKEIAEAAPGNKQGVEVTEQFETELLGEHNQKNIALAAAAASHLEVDEAIIKEVVKNFKGLPHRLESVGVHHNIEWVDDAISTTPESTIAGISALGDRVKIIILGGQDRGSDFTELAEVIVSSNIEHVILWPETGPQIKKFLEAANFKGSLHECDDMESALTYAKNTGLEGNPICLLSTASPSYNMFKNYEEQGDQFKAGATA